MSDATPMVGLFPESFSFEYTKRDLQKPQIAYEPWSVRSWLPQLAHFNNFIALQVAG